MGQQGHVWHRIAKLTSFFPPAAAAAKINAQLQARKGIQHVDVPPIRSESNAGSAGPPGGTINGEMYIADGDYIKDIEVNDLRNRYTLTKGSTQKMVNTRLVISADTSSDAPKENIHSPFALHRHVCENGLAYI